MIVIEHNYIIRNPNGDVSLVMVRWSQMLLCSRAAYLSRSLRFESRCLWRTRSGVSGPMHTATWTEIRRMTRALIMLVQLGSQQSWATGHRSQGIAMRGFFQLSHVSADPDLGWFSPQLRQSPGLLFTRSCQEGRGEPLSCLASSWHLWIRCVFQFFFP